MVLLLALIAVDAWIFLDARVREAGSPVAFVSQFVDVSEARQAREALQFQATHDSLTDLVNRRELTDRVEVLLSHTPRTGTHVAVLFIDLDGLKDINDTYGHAVGDDVIIDIAHWIKGRVRGDDRVARFGGDEYVVVLPTIHATADAEHVADKIQAASPTRSRWAPATSRSR